MINRQLSAKERETLLNPRGIDLWGPAAKVARKVQEWAQRLDADTVLLDDWDVALINAAAQELRICGGIGNPLSGGWTAGARKAIVSAKRIKEAFM